MATNNPNQNVSMQGAPNGNNTSSKQKISELTHKQWVLLGIVTLTTVFMLIGLAFPILHMELLTLKSTTTGFDIMGGHYMNAMESVATTVQLFVWLQFFATIGCLILLILSLVKFSKKVAARVQLSIMIIALVFSIFYLVCGAISVNASEGLGSTASYALFIIDVVLLVGYILCLKLLPERFTQAKKQPVQSEGSLTEQLKNYKELLDMGAITQEEYNKKKAELLNN